MSNVLVLAIIVLILGSAIGYIIWQKKRGVKCVGCSSACDCNNSHTAYHSLKDCTCKGSTPSEY